MNGPINGATRANGAKLISRYSSTLLRAASGLIEKNSDPASDTTIATSPAVINACVLARRLKGDTYMAGGGGGGGTGGRRPVDTLALYCDISTGVTSSAMTDSGGESTPAPMKAMNLYEQ